MASEQCGTDRVKTNVSCYEKEFSWEIVQFVDWWTSRDLAKLEGNIHPRNIAKLNDARIALMRKNSTLSPVIHFNIEGTKHDFRIAILKFEKWDRLDERHDTMMGISLYYDGPNESISVKPSFYTSNDDQNSGLQPETEQVQKGAYSTPSVFSGYCVEINRNLLSDQNFVVKCIAQVYSPTDAMEISYDNPSRNIPAHKFHIKDFKFSDGNRNFEQLSDFEIICIDKSDNGEESERRFRCHKLVLSSNSQYYERMFSSDYCENKGNVKVTDISSDTMEKLLRYLYTYCVPKTDIDEQLYYAADKYEISELKDICEKELAKGISLENIVSLAVAASLCGSNEFKSNIFGFLSGQWNNIQSSDQSQLAIHYPDILTHLLEKD